MGVQFDKVSTVLPIIEELNKRAIEDALRALLSSDGVAANGFTIEAESYKRVYDGLSAMVAAGLAD